MGLQKRQVREKESGKTQQTMLLKLHKITIYLVFACTFIINNASLAKSDYNRKMWRHWVDDDGDCQNTRAEILIRDSITEVFFNKKKGCVVKLGLWIDPYSGQFFSKASKLDIDH